ncbi:MAG: LPD38 domain-containing protein [Oscillospiraceae bacterium]|nr:LPD38 domain-containing protein [Oscillospiraceae bacterium]
MSTISERVKKLGGQTGIKAGVVTPSTSTVSAAPKATTATVSKSKSNSIADRVKKLGGSTDVNSGLVGNKKVSTITATKADTSAGKGTDTDTTTTNYANIKALGAGDYGTSVSPKQSIDAVSGAQPNADNALNTRYGRGNVDLTKRPQYKNPDGSISTVFSTSFNIDGKEVLLPQIWYDKSGKAYKSKSDEETLQHYRDNGEYLGKFDSVEAADAYAEKLHEQQDQLYGQKASTGSYANINALGAGNYGADKITAASEARKATVQSVDANLNNWLTLAQKDKLTAGEKKEAKTAYLSIALTHPSVLSGNYNLPASEQKYATLYKALYNKTYDNAAVKAAQAGIAGFLDALGVDWVTDKIMGTDNVQKQVQDYENKSTAGNTAGQMAGGLALVGSVGGVTDSILGNIGKFGKLGSTAQNAIRAATALGATSAYTSTTEQAWNEKEWSQKHSEPYSVWRSIGNVVLDTTTSALGGVAGSAAGQLVGGKILNALKGSNLSAKAMQTVAALGIGTTFGSVTGGLEEAKKAAQAAVNGDTYKFDWKSFATNAVVNGVYSALSTFANYSTAGTASSEKADGETARKWFSNDDLSSPEKLKKAYYDLSKQYHPDVGGNTATFQEINDAYQAALRVLGRNIVSRATAQAEPDTANGSNERVKDSEAISLLNQIVDATAYVPPVSTEMPLASPQNAQTPAQSVTAPVARPAEQVQAQPARGEAQRTSDTEGIIRTAAEMESEGSKAGAHALKSFYNDSIPAADFYADFAKVYEAGRNGNDINAVKTTVINPPTKQAAYISGQADAKRVQKAAQGEIPAAKKSANNTGTEKLISIDYGSQSVGSGGTSINKSKLPAVFSLVDDWKPGSVNLDLGGGKFDNAAEYLSGRGVKSYVLDKYNRTPEHNAEIARLTEEGKSDTVTISNVLNVIKEQSGRDEVLANAADAVKPGGTVYITVYEGNKSGTGKYTQFNKATKEPASWQENRLTISYLKEVRKYFSDVTSVKSGKLIIAKGPKKNKLKAHTNAGAVERLKSVNTMGQNKEKPAAESSGADELRISVAPEDRISAGMTEAERYEKLKNRGIRAYDYDTDRLAEIDPTDYTKLEKLSKSDAFAILRKIGEQFGVFGDYKNADMGIEFAFSKRKLNESVAKQNEMFQNYAKMMTIFRDVVESAIGIEAHPERYDQPESNVSQVYELVSAFRTDTGIVPVLLTVKEFNDGTKNSLHVIVSLNEINRSGVMEHTSAVTKADEPYSLYPASVYKLSDIFANVNIADGQLLKYIPDAFLDKDQIEAKKIAQRRTDEYTAKKNERRQTGDSIENSVSRYESPEARWTAARIGTSDKTPMPLSDIVNKARHDLGIPITKGNIRAANVLGQYAVKEKTIRTKIANDLPTLSHEIGHFLDHKYDLVDSAEADELGELKNNLSDEMKAAYTKKKWASEGLAEFMRHYFQNSETAAIDYPKFTAYMKNALGKDDITIIDGLADEINAYYSLDADTGASAIRISTDRKRDFRTTGEKIKDTADRLYSLVTDDIHGIKLFDEATNGDTYKLASNSAYSDAVAYSLLTGDLTDIHGQRVGDGLMEALKGINTTSDKEWRDFGDYLVARHGPERLAEGMRIYADDRKNSTQWMERLQAELEAKYPAFKDAAEKLYTFQRSFLKTWGVDTGLVSQDSYDEWGERWKYYVPLNRDVGEKGRMGAKRGFANQNSTIKKARGSGLEILQPVENIINNMVKMVNAGTRNNVMRTITEHADETDGSGYWLEPAPMPVQKKTFDATGLKKELKSAAESVGLSDMDEKSVFGIIDNLDDILVQYGRGKTYNDVVTVLVNGKPQYWKINDPMLLSSITNMSPSRIGAVGEAYGRVSRFMTGNITGANLVWSIFSNAPRDLMTYFTYSQYKKPLEMMAGIGSAYINKFKGSNADPLYKEYLAMGGGHQSAYTADKNLAKNIRKKMPQKKLEKIVGALNPLEYVDFISDMIELGPRYSYYRLLRNRGYSPEDAFFESTDITVNFRRGGKLGREINKYVPFFNAGVQGLDKLARYLSAADAPKGKRAKAVRGRFFGLLAASAILAAINMIINSGDDEAKGNYAQLSNYTKNTYWCIPLGSGKYFAIPKPRELAVLSSFLQAVIERYNNGNEHAFDEFYSYFADQCLPNLISDAAQGNISGVFGSLGIVGVGVYMLSNKDFLGRPIVSESLSNLETKDQYTDKTSKMAYWIGQAFNVSPQMVDYFFQNTLGVWWKVPKALFPIGSENIDYTLGVQNTYVKDNEYSTDLINRLYDGADKAAKKSNSNPTDMEAAVSDKWYSNMTTFYSNYSKLSKNDYDDVPARATRQTVLNMVAELEKNLENGYKNSAQQAVENCCISAGDTSYMPATMPTAVTDDDGETHALTSAEYVRYQTEYLGAYWDYVEDALSAASDTSTENVGNILSAAKAKAKSDTTAEALYRKGITTKAYTAMQEMQNVGLTGGDYAEFKSALKAADTDNNGSIKKSEARNALNSMDSLTDDQWRYLFQQAGNWK